LNNLIFKQQQQNDDKNNVVKETPIFVQILNSNFEHVITELLQ